jgi:hypothetical protein
MMKLASPWAQLIRRFPWHSPARSKPLPRVRDLFLESLEDR